MGLIISDGLGLPEPENPTQTGDIFPDPKNPNPKNLKISKPEPDKVWKCRKLKTPNQKLVKNGQLFKLKTH